MRKATKAVSERTGRRATLRDIAANAGVHVSTASRVLNGDPRGDISTETAERVRAVAKALHYRPNPVARSLRLQRAGAVGLLIPDLTHPTYAALVRGAFREAEQRGVVILIAEVPDDNLVVGLRRLIDDQRIDGLLVATAVDDSSYEARFRSEDLPVVYVNRRPPGMPTVTVNDEAGAAEALRAIFDCGHRRIGIITGAPGVDTSRRRLHGFRQEARKLGLAPPMESCGDYTATGGASALTRLMSQANAPTAIFASNLMSGIGALSRAVTHGIRVPDDLSLVVFDDAEIAEYTVPPLTRIKMPFDEMGALAVRSLLSVLDGHPAQDVMVTTPPRLIRGESLGVPGVSRDD